MIKYVDLIGAIVRITQTGEISRVTARSRDKTTQQPRVRLEGKHRGYNADEIEPVPATVERVEHLIAETGIFGAVTPSGDVGVLLNGSEVAFMHEAQIVLASMKYRRHMLADVLKAPNGMAQERLIQAAQATGKVVSDLIADAEEEEEEEEDDMEELTPNQEVQDMQFAQDLQEPNVLYIPELTPQGLYDLADFHGGEVDSVNISIATLSQELMELAHEKGVWNSELSAFSKWVATFDEYSGNLIGFIAKNQTLETYLEINVTFDESPADEEPSITKQSWVHAPNELFRFFVMGNSQPVTKEVAEASLLSLRGTPGKVVFVGTPDASLDIQPMEEPRIDDFEFANINGFAQIDRGIVYFSTAIPEVKDSGVAPNIPEGALNDRTSESAAV